jgi:hypothetical protein
MPPPLLLLEALLLTAAEEEGGHLLRSSVACCYRGRKRCGEPASSLSRKEVVPWPPWQGTGSSPSTPCRISRHIMVRQRQLTEKMAMARAPGSLLHAILDPRAPIHRSTHFYPLPVLAGGRAHRLLSSRLLSCITRRSGRACHDTSVSTQARLEPM